MIQFKIDQASINNMFTEFNKKYYAIEELTKPRTLEEIAKASFTISGKKFVAAVDRKAKIFPKKYHHVYEWNQVGSPNARLFTLKRAKISGGGHLVISAEFKTSNRPVPIPRALTTPGKTGKYVNKKHIFANKAQVMENGLPIRFQTSRTIAFLAGQGITFVPEGKVINILNPGGKLVRGAFKQLALQWYRDNYSHAVDSSGIFKNIENKLSFILNNKNAGPVQARQAIKEIAERYSEGISVI